MLKYLTATALFLLCLTAKSQCTKVCGTVSINGGSFTPSGTTMVTPAAGSTFTIMQKAGTTFTSQISQTAGTTLTVDAKGAYTVATTYSNVSAAGTNTILIGALSISIANVGTNGALFNGTTLPAGAIINLQIPNAILPQYTYNCLTSNLLVVVNR